MTGSIHLDTNYLVHFSGGKIPEVSTEVLGWIEKGLPLHVSAMAWAEFRCGSLTESEYALISKITSSVLPVTQKMATEAGLLFDATGRRSRSLADCIIAATAIQEEATLATLNRDDFTPFLSHGLKLFR